MNFQNEKDENPSENNSVFVSKQNNLMSYNQLSVEQ